MKLKLWLKGTITADPVEVELDDNLSVLEKQRQLWRMINDPEFKKDLAWNIESVSGTEELDQVEAYTEEVKL